MTIQPLDNSTSTAAAALLSRPSGDGFARQLRQVEAQASDAAKNGGLDPETSRTLRKAAEQLVATTFIQPMLAKMREDPFKTDLFHGGRAEEIFGQQLDTVLSERIVSKSNFAIVDAVYQTIAERAAQKAGEGMEVDIHA